MMIKFSSLLFTFALLTLSTPAHAVAPGEQRAEEMRVQHEACLTKHDVTAAQIVVLKECGKSMHEKHATDERPKDQEEANQRMEKNRAEFEACLSGKLKDGFTPKLKTALQECRPPRPGAHR